MYLLWHFLKRGYITFLSYRTALVLSVLGSFVGLLQFSFMGKFLSQGNLFPSITQYGNSLLGYLILGNAFASFSRRVTRFLSEFDQERTTNGDLTAFAIESYCNRETHCDVGCLELRVDTNQCRIANGSHNVFV